MNSLTSIISNERRKLLLRYLLHNNGRATLEDVITYICEKEGDPQKRNRKSVYISLKQTHIPKLERARIVYYDRSSNMLHLEERYLNDVKMYIEFVEGGDISWSKYYLVLGSISAAGSLLVMDTLAIVISIALVTSSLLQTMKVRKVF
ncbi:DUF7344 domain-containing protein [Geoglobus acetivorans]|uniref:DUF7344 domain-containing protein n=1 Tax=Geoglobus acetivorans TaxID=565033 RepID=A0ABZ3H7L5_GEOAI|nr:hypothetical protein [Geoglobus acetivorans]